MSNRRTFLILLALYALWLVALGIAPLDRPAWRIQNSALVGGVAALVVTRRWFAFSRMAYVMIFAFLALAAVGAHYTYQRTPYDAWFVAVTGRTLNGLVGWDRNNFDRIVHFAYGFLIAYPVRELFLRVADVRGFWGYALPLDVVMSTSMLWELAEWVTAAAFAGGDQLYIGTQGDVWDTHKDMALATLGAAISIGLVAAINRVYHRDFGREWADSLRVKQRDALEPDGFAWLTRPKR